MEIERGEMCYGAPGFRCVVVKLKIYPVGRSPFR